MKKAIILIAFLLLASVFFLPTLTLARQLNEAETVSGGTNDPNKPAIKCDPNNRYVSCAPKKRPCPPYVRNC